MTLVSRLNRLDDAVLSWLRHRGVSNLVHAGLRACWDELSAGERRALCEAALRCEVTADPERARWLAALQGAGAARRSAMLRRVRSASYAWAPVEVLAGIAVGVPVVLALLAGVLWVLLTRELVRSTWVPIAAASSIANGAVARRAGRSLEPVVTRRSPARAGGAQLARAA